jgi:hypothetical protein
MNLRQRAKASFSVLDVLYQDLKNNLTIPTAELESIKKARADFSALIGYHNNLKFRK